MLRNIAKVGSNTLVSRVLGLVRDVVFARLFGADAATDAFFIAFKIPNFLRRLFAEGAFSQGFVPVLAEYKSRQGDAEVRELAQRTAGTLGGILLLITLIGVLAAPVLVTIFAPGFLAEGEEGRFALTVDMLRIMFPYLLFISLTALAGGILNTYGRFGVPALAPAFLNIVLIAAAIWVAPHLEQPVMALAWGVLIAGVVQLAFMLPFLAQLKLLARPRWGWRHPGVQRIQKLMLPAIFGSSVVQINLLFDTLIASFLVAGSVSWLYYSDRLVEFPLGVFGIALATVILPGLSQQHAETAPDGFARILDWAGRWVLLIAVPATLGLLLLAGPILSAIFGYGEFDTFDLRMSQLSLMAYALGLPAFILIKVLASGFYARQDTRTPVRIGIIAMLANMLMNILIVVPMAWFDIAGAHAGLALATSLSAYLNAGLLFRRLRRENVWQSQPGWMALALKIAAAGLLMAVALWWFTPALTQWPAWTSLERASRLGLWIGIGAGVYGGLLVALGLRWRDFNRPLAG